MKKQYVGTLEESFYTDEWNMEDKCINPLLPWLTVQDMNDAWVGEKVISPKELCDAIDSSKFNELVGNLHFGAEYGCYWLPGDIYMYIDFKNDKDYLFA
jgi:hypothetical protein